MCFVTSRSNADGIWVNGLVEDEPREACYEDDEASDELHVGWIMDGLPEKIDKAEVWRSVLSSPMEKVEG